MSSEPKINVNIRFLCFDIYVEGRNDFDFELPEGAALKSLIIEAQKLPHVGLPLDELEQSTLLVNNEKSDLDRVLRDGDKVTLLRLLGGG